ncbi:MAG: response regulator transcription factor, partial [Lachnospiraceae bacterium]|nr:response regulator transcription factor [Lachnospiraceae bacterium]
GIECTCLLFASAKQVMEYKGEKMLLLFLDIEMPGMSGVELLQKLESGKKVWRVVFATSHEESKIETVSIRTLGFESKPAPYQNIGKYIEIALKESGENVNVLIKICGEEKIIALDDLDFAEAEGNYSTLVMGDKKILTDESLKEVEKKMFMTNVLRCHKSYLVNLGRISEITGDVIVMNNGSKIPIGRTFKKKIMEDRKRFLVNLAMGRT